MADRKPSPDIVIIDLVDDENESMQKENLQHLDSVKKRLKSETPTEGDAKKRKTVHEEEDDEVICVEQPTRFCQAVSTTDANNNDADIELVGTLNEQRLPHMRQHCTVQPFRTMSATNAQFCTDCYCYVCDVPVQECTNWTSHKDATNEGPEAGLWVRARERAKQERNKQKKAPFRPRKITPRPAPATTVATTTAAATTPTSVAAPAAPTAATPSATASTAAAVAAPAPSAAAAVAAARDPRVVLGTHFRPDCPHNRYDPLRAKMNTYSCPQCICYVCCKKPMQCPNWHVRFGNLKDSHCNASDRPGSLYPYWQSLQRKHADEQLAEDARRQAEQRVLEEKQRVEAEKQRVEAEQRRVQEEKQRKAALIGPGPFPPDKPGIKETQGVVRECRHCGWFSRRESSTKLPSQKDLCHACGRVRAMRYLEKATSSEYSVTRHPGIFLGTKEIGFTLHPRDPRGIGRYKYLWEHHEDEPGWVYNQEDFEEEVFLHMIGTRPELALVAASLGYKDCVFGEIYNAAVWRQNGNNPVMQLEDETQTTILKEILWQASAFGRNRQTKLSSTFPSQANDTAFFVGDLQATWDKAQRKGVLKIRAYLRLPENGYRCTLRMSRFLGVWNGALPFSEQTMAEIMTPKQSNSEQPKLSLVSGSDSKHLGGFCTNETDFSGTLARFFRDVKPGIVVDMYRPEQWQADYDRRHDKTSDEIRRGIKSLNGLMDHMENLGHEPSPFVEGLTVELLPFQSQTVQWAYERETIGIQAFQWLPIPMPKQSQHAQAYLNLVTGDISSTKPVLLRGGIIAEQMGLGKTVISLALVMRNPAPALPAPGQHVSKIPTTVVGPVFRDPDLYDRTSRASSKLRGSILSRGTLVVCNVSLVGQWIEEAKSKLKDPGLVYSYHGSSRIRDPQMLAQNSIVVTTYETLSSDVSYHSKGHKLGEYCAPCEQVRWWRIICDESHLLRNANNGKSKAVMALVADNKWLVSGTPINTSIMDLQNQLKFLGFENANDLMSTLQKDDDRRLFSFFMRSIMMRHSQKQKYIGTSTTLMSLPPKTEKTILVPFSNVDKKEYETVEANAKDAYRQFKEMHEGHLSRHYLKLLSMISPMRISCAGGRLPLDNEEGEESEKGKKRAPQKYSDFAFTSKLLKLVEQLKTVRTSDPTAKSLVFSQYASTLKWLQEELPKHGFQFRTLSGDMPMRQRAKALSEFQNDPPTTIFLLSMRAGACGINLTQASHVFLMEPSLNPALEAQAVGRVHRLGQKRPVQIIRLIMKDSVESRMQNMLKSKYGSSSATSTEDGDEKKPSVDPIAATAVMVGSLKSEKAVVMEEEFDTLFGVSI